MANKLITSGMLERHNLKHYGVKGMKWGVRKEPEQSGRKTSQSKVDNPDVSVNSLELVLLNLGLILLPAAIYGAASNVGNKKVMAKAESADLKITKLSLASKISPPESYRQSSKNTNNTRSINKNYNNNCPNTTMAYELRRRGYDVKAKPAPHGMVLDDIQKDYGIKTPAIELRNLNKSVSYKTQDAMLKDYFKSMPDGYRGAITVTWKDVSSGHIFNVEKVNGRTMFIDSQNGKSGEFKGLSRGREFADKTTKALQPLPIYKTGPSNYLTMAKDVFIFRTDDAKISEKNISDRILRG